MNKVEAQRHGSRDQSLGGRTCSGMAHTPSLACKSYFCPHHLCSLASAPTSSPVEFWPIQPPLRVQAGFHPYLTQPDRLQGLPGTPFPALPLWSHLPVPPPALCYSLLFGYFTRLHTLSHWVHQFFLPRLQLLLSPVDISTQPYRSDAYTAWHLFPLPPSPATEGSYG